MEVHEQESGHLAGTFLDRVCHDEGIHKDTATVLHSKTGAPMRSFSLAAKLTKLGVKRSF